MKMKLTDAACRKKPGAEPFKLFDGGGLYLLVNPSGTRQWKLAYRFDGKPKTISFGSFPDVPLGDARAARDKARGLIAKGINPSQQRKDDKAAIAATRSFGSVFEEWFKKFQTDNEKIKPRTERRNKGMMQHILVHPIAKRGIGHIEPSELLVVLQIQEDRGFLENATRLRAMCETVFRYGMARGYNKHNPAAALEGAFVSPKVKPMPAITEPVAAGKLLRAIAAYEGYGPLTRAAMQFLALTFPRPGEQRQAEWSEFNFETAIWLIPASKMKKGIAHDIPLSRQAIAILESVRPLTGEGRYVFSTGSAPMSDNTVNKALRSMGYDTKTDHCAHGFRAMASTLLNGEYKDDLPRWNPEVVEMCLARNDTNAVRAAYNRAKCLPQRIKLMQHWADRIDAMRDGAKIVPLKRKRA
jgi:integrase